ETARSIPPIFVKKSNIFLGTNPSIKIKLGIRLPKQIELAAIVLSTLLILCVIGVFFLGYEASRVKIKSQVQAFQLAEQVSHDIRSPLMALKAAKTLLKTNHIESLPIIEAVI